MNTKENILKNASNQTVDAPVFFFPLRKGKKMGSINCLVTDIL